MRIRSAAIVGGPIAPHRREVSLDDVSDDEGLLLKHGLAPKPRWLRLTRLIRFSKSAEPLVLSGDCLAPWLIAGDLVYYARDEEPLDGDLVVFDQCYSCTIDGEHKNIIRKAVKQLRVLADGSRYLICNQGYFDLQADGTKIDGPIVAWYRPRFWRRPPVRKMHFDLPVKVFDRSS